jgi:ABC-type transporter Mla MlaB component
MGATAHTFTFAVRGPIAREDLPGLCQRVCALFAEHGPALAHCDVETVAADAVTVDALARLQLAARRSGCDVRLRHASPELRALVAFLGLDAVLPEAA